MRTVCHSTHVREERLDPVPIGGADSSQPIAHGHVERHLVVAHLSMAVLRIGQKMETDFWLQGRQHWWKRQGGEVDGRPCRHGDGQRIANRNLHHIRFAAARNKEQPAHASQKLHWHRAASAC